MIIIFWLGLMLLALTVLAAAGILADPELAAKQSRAAGRRAADWLDRGLLSRGLDRLERHAATLALLLFLLVDAEAATR